MTRAVLRDPALQAQFDRMGYVEVPMLDGAQITALIDQMARLRPSDRWTPDGSGLAMNSYHCSFLDLDVDYKRAAFELLERSFAPVLARYLDDFRALSANFYSKPPSRGRIPIHQNWPVLDDLAGTSVTVWCPLVDVDVMNGALHVIPGSHKLVPHVEGPRSPSFFAGFEHELDAELLPLPASAGTGFIFDDSIVHGSPDNHSETSRLAVQITCIPGEAKPVFYYTASPSEFEMVEADNEFYLLNSVANLSERQQDWVSRGLVSSSNRPLDKSEFLDRLDCKMGRVSERTAHAAPRGLRSMFSGWFGRSAAS